MVQAFFVKLSFPRVTLSGVEGKAEIRMMEFF